MATTDSLRAAGQTGSYGTTYNTLASWLAAIPADLSGQGVQKLYVYNDWTNGVPENINITNSNGGASDYVHLEASPEAGTQGSSDHGGTIRSGAWFAKDYVGSILTGTTAYCRFIRIGAENLRTASANFPGVYSTAGNWTFDGVWIATGQAGFAAWGISGSGWTVDNCFGTTRGAAGNGFRLGQTVDINHSVAYDCGTDGFVRTSGTGNTNHCVGHANTGDDFDASISGGDYNADDDGSAPGAKSFTLTGDPFTGSTNDDFTHGSGSELTDAGGTTGAGVSIDCAGTSRPQNTNYDVGWFEYVAAGGITGTGAVTAQLDSVTGLGVVAVAGIGATVAELDTVTGLGGVIVAGAGTATAEIDSVAGTGSAAGIVSGTGAAVAELDAVTGLGVVTVIGAGAPAAELDQVMGLGAVLVTGSGTTVAELDAVAGTGSTTGLITGTGAAVAELDSVAGVGGVVVAAVGAVIAEPDQVTGAGVAIVAGIGATVTELDILAGLGAVLVTGSGAAVEELDQVQSFAGPVGGIVSHPTIRDLTPMRTIRNL